MKPHNRSNVGAAPADRREASQNKRYSFVETPVEMRGSAFRPDESIPPLPTIPTENTNPTATLSHPALAQDLSEKRSSTPYNYPPITQPHPAHDEMASEAQDQAWRPPQANPPDTPMTPHSPGPVPIKSDLEAREDPNTRAAAPADTNAHQTQFFAAPQRVFSSFQPEPMTVQGGVAVGLHSPGQITHPNQRVVGGGWTHGLCDCGEVSTYCTGIFCPCLLYGKTQYRLSQRSTRKDPTNMLGYESCNGSCISFSVLCGFQWLLTTIQHTRTRKQYEIDGNVGSDCVRSCCCCCCVLVQDEREIKYREGHARRNAGPATGAAVIAPYASTPTMTYATPPR